MELAFVTAKRATCDRKHVGAVLVRDNVILSTGYNGSVRGLPHCDDVGHMLVEGHCVRTVHAEINAIASAARNGVLVAGATAYVTASPCWGCFKALANAGVQRVVFAEFYRDATFVDAAMAAKIGVEMLHILPPTCEHALWEAMDSKADRFKCGKCGIPESLLK